ncbi:Cold-regulated 413 plasma membrane protein 2 [Ananas comosus]|uniref:Cold-regulated 413 plasma membrane protein 2 n=1 Tax=Ananas comosus TaxID=4615 RepID=A0A199VPL3_ANACO|nr:Cold-regulated 413 plasma membrane protein 2 [Ananas comosus]
MGKMAYLAMESDQVYGDLIESDLKEIGVAARRLANHAFRLGSGLGFGTTFLKFLASFAAIGEVGKWIALIVVVLRLFFPRHFPDWLEMPGALILLLVVAPNFFAHTIRDHLVGVFICLFIGCYLLQEHIRASGGFRNAFTKSHGVSNTIGIILLFAYPVWRLVLYFL